jgi:hypothetical protein
MAGEIRDKRGRFLPGNPGGPGHPHARKPWKIALETAVTPEEITTALRKLYEVAMTGDVAAIRELFDRVIGKPTKLNEAANATPMGLDLDGTAADAVRSVFQSMDRGDISAEQALRVMGVIEGAMRARDDGGDPVSRLNINIRTVDGPGGKPKRVVEIEQDDEESKQ